MKTKFTALEQQLNHLIQAGYDQLSPGLLQPVAACNAWLETWELVKQMTTPEIRTVEAFETAHPHFQPPLGNWLSDLEMELHNAGLDDRIYFEHRVRFVHGYLATFPETDGDTYLNLRRAEGEALWLLDRPAEAEAVYQALVEKLPNHAWAYIGWADQYTWGHGRPLKYERAEALLKQALARPHLDDRKYVLERLIDLYTHWNRLEEIRPLQLELIQVLKAKEKTALAEIEILEKYLQEHNRSIKLARNGPCWWGARTICW